MQALAALAVLALAAEPQRLHAARARVEPRLRALFAQRGVAYPGRALLLRAFKADDALELWARGTRRFVHLRDYRICARSGGLGPKRREGDGQVPEGFYRVVGENPWSQFHLSLRIDYPNRSDRILGDARPGGDIFIHGSCVTIGCLPLGDEAIEELFVLVHDARAGRARVDVHLFPGRSWDALEGTPELRRFWAPLREAARLFDERRVLPRIRISRDGSYQVRP